MRHSKRTYCPDWDERDWDYGTWRSSSSHKRKKRSHSAVREHKRCKYDHSKTTDSYYLESRSINEKAYHSRRYVDEYRNDYMGYEPGYPYGEPGSRYQNHSSKSSGRSGRSSYKSKHRGHHHTSRRRSHGVWAPFKHFEFLFPVENRKQFCVWENFKIKKSSQLCLAGVFS